MKKHVVVAVSALVLSLSGAMAAKAAPVPLDIKDDAGAVVSGDADKGAVVFHKCQACHSIKAGDNRIGPSLNGVIGRKAGTVAGFNYSPANKNSGISWTEQTIFAYLVNPQKFVPGTKMSFPGLPKADERADVIAYLATAAK